MDFFERLARGIYNKEETIVSKSYAERMDYLLKANNCLNEKQDLIIGRLKTSLLSKQIDIRELNTTI